MRKKITDTSQYLKQPYSRVLIPNEDGSYSAEILELHGCYAQGATPNEAIENLEAAATDWILAALSVGQTIPEPSLNIGYSGHFALRLPRSLHRNASRMAERDGTSLNQFLVTAISARVGAEDLFSYLADRIEQRLAASTATIVFSRGTIRAMGSGLDEPRMYSTEWVQVPIDNSRSAPFLIPGPEASGHG